MDILFLVICVVCLLYFGYHFILAWFYPKRVLEIYKRTKRKDKEIFTFLPSKIIDALFFFDNPKVSIWWSRIGTTLALLIT